MLNAVCDGSKPRGIRDGDFFSPTKRLKDKLQSKTSLFSRRDFLLDPLQNASAKPPLRLRKVTLATSQVPFFEQGYLRVMMLPSLFAEFWKREMGHFVHSEVGLNFNPTLRGVKRGVPAPKLDPE